MHKIPSCTTLLKKCFDTNQILHWREVFYKHHKTPLEEFTTKLVKHRVMSCQMCTDYPRPDPSSSRVGVGTPRPLTCGYPPLFLCLTPRWTFMHPPAQPHSQNSSCLTIWTGGRTHAKSGFTNISDILCHTPCLLLCYFTNAKIMLSHRLTGIKMDFKQCISHRQRRKHLSTSKSVLYLL